MAADPNEAADVLTPVGGDHVYAFAAIVPIATEEATDVECPDRIFFQQWDGDVDDVLAASTMVEMDENQTVVAQFSTVNDYYNTCGDICHPYPDADYNHDCIVNLEDFAWLGECWMQETPTSITVANADFEDPYVEVGSALEYTKEEFAPGPWRNSELTQNYSQIYIDNRTQYWPVRSPTGGGQAGLCYQNGATYPNFNYQVLGEKFEEGMVYIVQADIELSFYGNSTYSVRLMGADTQTVVVNANQDNNGLVTTNRWLVAKASAQATGDVVGEDIVVAIGGQTVQFGLYYDSVRVWKLDPATVYDFDDLSTLVDQWLEDTRP